MKYTLYLVVIFLLLNGCAVSMTYEEMSDAYEIAETEEEKQALMAKIETFENNADKAEVFFDNRRACSHVWFCDNVKAIDEKRIKNLDLDGLVRAYKKEYQSCGCSKTSDIRNLSRY